MFTPSERERLRSALIAAAQNDERITGIALTGSAAVEREDEWSDIDLAFGVRDPATLPAVLADFTARMHGEHDAVDHFDVTAGAWIYRVFLLRDTLQVDLAFAPAAEFGARAPTFRLVHGAASTLPQPARPDPQPLIGMAWLYALHARSAIARGRLWQAEYMVSGIRDQVVALACLRYGVPHLQGRGVDGLPADARDRLAATLVTRLEADELRRAFRAAVGLLLDEVRHVDASLDSRIGETVRALAA